MEKPLRVGLLHQSINITGGVERFVVDMIPILRNSGMQVCLATFDRVKWDFVTNTYGSCERPDMEKSLLPFTLKLFGIYQKLLMIRFADRIKRISDVTINADIERLYYYSDIVFRYGITEFDESLIRYRNPLLKMYFIPYEHFAKKQKSMQKEGTVFVTTSRFIQEKMNRLANATNSRVIYPPVDTETYSKAIGSDRDNQVVTIGRLAKDKNLHLLPEIASKCPSDVKFAVVTAAKDIRNNLVLEDFTKACKLHGVESRVTVHVNASFDEKLDFLRKSKVYLHLKMGEGFGLAVAEASSAGCLPIVPKGGGQEEIVEGIPNSVYENYSEVPDLIRLAIDSWTAAKSKQVSQMMERFSKKSFSDQFCPLVREVYLGKRR